MARTTTLTIRISGHRRAGVLVKHDLEMVRGFPLVFPPFRRYVGPGEANGFRAEGDGD